METALRPIFVAIIGLLMIAGVCVAGAGYLIEEATEQAKQEAKVYP